MEQNLFGQILLNFNLITQKQLDKAVELQLKSNPPRLLGELLVEQGVINEKSLRSILSVQQRRIELSKATSKPSPKGELDKRLRGAALPEFLKTAQNLGASDFYFSTGLRPLIRLHGNLIDLPADPPSFEESRNLLFELLTKEQTEEYVTAKNVDFGLELPGIGRFRASVFRHFQGIAGTFRTIADKTIPFEDLDLPPAVRRFLDASRGLILITGPGGSGKTMTLAAMIDLMNRTQSLHIITIEDPIEIIHKNDKCFISQRQVPGHSKSFSTALRAALREDPDVIVVGELRDPETVQTAVTAAETGHLIFGTLHTHNATRTITRLLDQFPPQKQGHIRTLLAGVLRGVVSQQLLPNLDGRGRSLATEVLVVNMAVANLIREDRVWQIPMTMQTNRQAGMRLMDDSLMELVQRKKVPLGEALVRATDRTRFMGLEAVKPER